MSLLIQQFKSYICHVLFVDQYSLNNVVLRMLIQFYTDLNCDYYLSDVVTVYLRCRQTGNMYKNVKRKIEKGVAFPTCISVNNTVSHFSPLASDESVLEEGDMVKM